MMYSVLSRHGATRQPRFLGVQFIRGVLLLQLLATKNYSAAPIDYLPIRVVGTGNKSK